MRTDTHGNGRVEESTRWAFGLGVAACLVGVLAIASVTGAAPSTKPSPAPDPGQTRLAGLELRAGALSREMRRARTAYLTEVRPLKRELLRRRNDDTLVTRIAFALVREGRRAGVDPQLLASVLLVEDPELDPEAVSSAGAIGLMQVMPRHQGAWGCGGDDLTDPDVNICHGARILANDIELAHGDLDRALLRYNGCVRGVRTPDCRLYPLKVYREASLARFRARPSVDSEFGLRAGD